MAGNLKQTEHDWGLLPEGLAVVTLPADADLSARLRQLVQEHLRPELVSQEDQRHWNQLLATAERDAALGDPQSLRSLYQLCALLRQRNADLRRLMATVRESTTWKPQALLWLVAGHQYRAQLRTAVPARFHESRLLPMLGLSGVRWMHGTPHCRIVLGWDNGQRQQRLVTSYNADAASQQRFERERRVLRALRGCDVSPQLLRVSRRHRAIVTAAPKCGSLREFVGRSEAHALQNLILLQQTLQCLQRMHARGLLHGSLNPDCILIDDLTSVRFTRFSLSAPVATAKPRAERVDENMGYSNVELLQGQAATIRSDLAAVAISWLEVLLGRQLFANVPAMHLVQAQQEFRINAVEVAGLPGPAVELLRQLVGITDSNSEMTAEMAVRHECFATYGTATTGTRNGG